MSDAGGRGSRTSGGAERGEMSERMGAVSNIRKGSGAGIGNVALERGAGGGERGEGGGARRWRRRAVVHAEARDGAVIAVVVAARARGAVSCRARARARVCASPGGALCVFAARVKCCDRCSPPRRHLSTRPRVHACRCVPARTCARQRGAPRIGYAANRVGG